MSEGHPYGDIPVVDLSAETYTDLPVVGDAAPAAQPDTGRQPEPTPPRFTYPLPGKHGDLGTTG